jgi:hypothetical protein
MSYQSQREAQRAVALREALAWEQARLANRARGEVAWAA